MRRSTTTRSLISLAVAIALIAVLAVLASGAAGGSPSPSPSGDPSAGPASPSPDPSSAPSDDPSPSPSDEPSPTPAPTEEPTPSPEPTDKPTPAPTKEPTPAPTKEPTPAPTDEAGIPLDIATPHEVSVVIDDVDDVIADAASGQAGDGMSVRWFEVKVENVDADTLRVTWVGLPQDDVVRLTVSAGEDGVSLRFVQKSPPANSDAMGHDRVLVLDFEDDVDAGSVEATIEHGTDQQS